MPDIPQAPPLRERLIARLPFFYGWVVLGAGTLGSAALLFFAGRLYDRWGARILGTAAAAGLFVFALLG